MAEYNAKQGRIQEGCRDCRRKEYSCVAVPVTLCAYVPNMEVSMDSQKIENLLNLSLDATSEERGKSEALQVGYDREDAEWEIIVKHTRSLDRIKNEVEGISSIVELSGGYAIVTIAQRSLERFAAYEEIENIEKPKRLFFTVDTGRAASCIDVLQQDVDMRAGIQTVDRGMSEILSEVMPVGDVSKNNLTGAGVIFSCIDSGIDYAHPDFRNDDGTTRILYLWDQTSTGGNPPAGYTLGSEYTQEQINEALTKTNRAERLAIVPTTDDGTGHGTAVAGIGAGNGRASVGRRYRGVAIASSLIIVKLGKPRSDGFPRTTEVMQAVDYVIKKAVEIGMPIAVNLSFGNNYGPHDGTSLLESYIDSMANVWKSSIIIGSGNEGDSNHHTSGTVLRDRASISEFAVGTFIPSLSLQIWKQYFDEMDIYILAPNGQEFLINSRNQYTQRFRVLETELLVYSGEPTPYSMAQEIFIEMIPQGTNPYITSGIWKIRLEPRKIVDGSYHMWLPSTVVIGEDTKFLQPSPDVTLTIPSVSGKAVTVGAYNQLTDAAAPYSGRGYATNRMIKPDIVAPGEQIMTAAPEGGYARKTGTSMATPFVTGSAALLMEWGIVRGNSPFLYGEKLKAYLIAGARPLTGFNTYPNPQTGYGALCLSDSIPE